MSGPDEETGSSDPDRGGSAAGGQSTGGPTAGGSGLVQDGADLGDLTFAEALGELEAIVAALESDALDVDHLAARVQRAAELVAWCRDRIDGTRYRVEEILERLDGGAT